MKRTLTLIFLLVSVVVNAKYYYVASNGKDSNPGTIDSPFATWGKLSSVLAAGDIAYIRGGTYRTAYSASAYSHVALYSLKGTSANNIQILAYPGEYPVLNLDNIIPTGSYCFAFFMQDCNYIYVKGLRITGLPQSSIGNSITGMYIVNSPNCVFEECEVDHIGGYGIGLGDGSNNMLFKNCDVHHCSDPYTQYENANGFNITGKSTATDITYYGCRAWKNADDGWDFFLADGKITLNNCWSFWNGFDDNFNRLGDGNAFKLGPNATDQSSTLLRTITNCIAAKNESNGFDQNTSDYSCIMYLYNNAAYDNGSAGFQFSYINGIANEFINNISWGNDFVESSLGKGIIQSNNTWNSGITVSDADFGSVNVAELERSRKDDGSLPDVDFMHLKSGSDLIDAGLDVGLDFNGSAPDVGAFETGSPIIPAVPAYTGSVVENATPSTLTMTYSLSLANIVPAISAFTVQVNSVARTITSVAVSGTKVNLTLASAVLYGDVVTVGYNQPISNPLQTPAGGEAFSVSFQPVTNKVASPIPVYLSSAIENATPSLIEITYDKSLANIIPAASSFSVRVNLVARTVNTVSVSGAKVILTLASPVIYGEAVTLSYTKPSANPLQTPSGGQAASISAQTVTNKTVSAVPVYVSSAIENSNPSVIEMTYDKSLANIIPAPSSFSIQVNLVARSVNNVAISGTKVILTLVTPIVYGETVKVSYTKPPVNQLQSPSGGQAASLNAQTVINKIVSAIPVYVSSVIENSAPSVIEITYDISLASIIPATSSFAVKVNSIFRNVVNVTVSGIKASLLLANSVVYGDIITVAYTKPSSNPLQSVSSGQALSFTAKNVTNNCLEKVDNPGKVKLKIYPNPAQNFINIIFDDAALSAKFIKIFDLSGMLVHTEYVAQGISKVQIPINLKAGIYFVTLEFGDLILYTQELIIIN
jgi:uncharacterized repeat protein (TIGR02059 family)